MAMGLFQILKEAFTAVQPYDHKKAEFTNSLEEADISAGGRAATAKGGIVLAIAQDVGVPVKFVGVGEGIDDLKPFDPTAFVQDMI